MVGGSVASSLCEIPQATQDVDLVAEVWTSHVDALMAALIGDFYIDAEMIEDAIKRRSSFNVVHLTVMFKADVFVGEEDRGHARRWCERGWRRLMGPAERWPFAAVPEDTLLHKLVWYKLGNQVSDHRWATSSEC